MGLFDHFFRKNNVSKDLEEKELEKKRVSFVNSFSPVSKSDYILIDTLLLKSDKELAQNVLKVVGRVPQRPIKVDFWSATVLLCTIALSFKETSDFRYKRTLDVIHRFDADKEIMCSNSIDVTQKISLSLDARSYMNEVFKLTDDLGVTDIFYNNMMYHLDTRVDSIKDIMHRLEKDNYHNLVCTCDPLFKKL